MALKKDQGSFSWFPPFFKPSCLIHQPVLSAYLQNISYVIPLLSMDTTNITVIQATDIFYLQQELLPGFCSHFVFIPGRVIIPDIMEIMPLAHVESPNGFPLHLKSTHLTHKAPHDRILLTSQILFHTAPLPPAHYTPASLAFLLFLKLTKFIPAPESLYLLFLLPRMIFFQIAAWLAPFHLSRLKSSSISLHLKLMPIPTCSSSPYVHTLPSHYTLCV